MLKKILKFKKNKEDKFVWASLSSSEKKRIIKKSVLGSNKLQKDLFDRSSKTLVEVK